MSSSRILPAKNRTTRSITVSTIPEGFTETVNFSSLSFLETFRVYAPTPYVVAANKQDLEDAWEIDDIRIALRLDPKVKLLPCIATDRESVKSNLLELLYSILAEMDMGN